MELLLWHIYLWCHSSDDSWELIVLCFQVLLLLHAIAYDIFLCGESKIVP